MKSLSPQTTLKLIAAFEASTLPMVGCDGQRLSGIPAWSLSASDQHRLTDWLCGVGYAGVYDTAFGDERVSVDLEDDDDAGCMRFRCPETLRWRKIPRNASAIFQVKEPDFLSGIAELLGIPNVERNGIARAVVPGYLWRLGTARLSEGFHAEIWLARGLSSQIKPIIHALALRSTQCLLLCCTKPPSLIAWPINVHPILLAEMIPQHLTETHIDKDALYRAVLGHAVLTDSTGPVRYDPHRQQLCIQGKAPWIIKGEKHAKAVEYLYQQALKGRWEVKAAEILAAASSRSRTVTAFFQGSPIWQDYIHSPKHGYYAFKLQ